MLKIKRNSTTKCLYSLIMATGTKPFVPPIKDKEKQGVYVLRSIDDGEKEQAIRIQSQ